MCCNYQITKQCQLSSKTLLNDDDVNTSRNDSVVINLINTLITFAITRLTTGNVERCLRAPTQVCVTQYEKTLQSPKCRNNTVMLIFTMSINHFRSTQCPDFIHSLDSCEQRWFKPGGVEDFMEFSSLRWFHRCQQRFIQNTTFKCALME